MHYYHFMYFFLNIPKKHFPVICNIYFKVISFHFFICCKEAHLKKKHFGNRYLERYINLSWQMNYIH